VAVPTGHGSFLPGNGSFATRRHSTQRWLDPSDRRRTSLLIPLDFHQAAPVRTIFLLLPTEVCAFFPHLSWKNRDPSAMTHSTHLHSHSRGASTLSDASARRLLVCRRPLPVKCAGGAPKASLGHLSTHEVPNHDLYFSVCSNNKTKNSHGDPPRLLCYVVFIPSTDSQLHNVSPTKAWFMSPCSRYAYFVSRVVEPTKAGTAPEPEARCCLAPLGCERCVQCRSTPPCAPSQP
jgi:hypothetical protein